MRINQLLESARPTFSFEIYPPRTEAGWQKLLGRISNLTGVKIDFVSLTSGRSQNQVSSNEIARDLLDLGIPPLVHVTCTGRSKAEIEGHLQALEQVGVENILIIRGEGNLHPEGFGTVKDLVSYVKGNFTFCVGVAGYPQMHPEASSPSTDWRNLIRKVQAGADFILTQLFFDNQDYYTFCQRLKDSGVKQPVLAGLMPLLEERNLGQFVRFGVRVPEVLEDRFKSAATAHKGEQIGISYTTTQIQDLLEHGVAGIHLYTMNKLTTVPTIFGGISVKRALG